MLWRDQVTGLAYILTPKGVEPVDTTDVFAHPTYAPKMLTAKAALPVPA